MLKTHALIMLSFFFFHCANVFAGGASDVGGGGNAVVCFDDPSIAEKVKALGSEIPDEYVGNIASVEILDLYEARSVRGIQTGGGLAPALLQPMPTEAVHEYVDRIINRVSSVIPEVSQDLQKYKNIFAENRIFRHDKGLVKVSDSKEVQQVATGPCVLSTMAIQYVERGEIFLHVDWRLYNHPKHSLWSKAVTLLHEYYYRRELDKGATDSRKTRLQVGLSISENVPVAKLAQAFSAKLSGVWPYSTLLPIVQQLVSVGYRETTKLEKKYDFMRAKEALYSWTMMIASALKLEEYLVSLSSLEMSRHHLILDPVAHVLGKLHERSREFPDWKKAIDVLFDEVQSMMMTKHIAASYAYIEVVIKNQAGLMKLLDAFPEDAKWKKNFRMRLDELTVCDFSMTKPFRKGDVTVHLDIFDYYKRTLEHKSGWVLNEAGSPVEVLDWQADLARDLLDIVLHYEPMNYVLP